jgi:hypothetical protein
MPDGPRTSLCSDLDLREDLTREACATDADDARLVEAIAPATQVLERCQRSAKRARCRPQAEEAGAAIQAGAAARERRVGCQRARQREEEVRAQLRGLPSPDGGADPLCPPCAAEGSATIQRGRLALVVGGGTNQWIDIEVQGADRDAVEVCRQLIEVEAEQAARLPREISHEIARACGTAPLPRGPGQPAVLLIERARVGSTNFLMRGLADPCLQKRTNRIRGTRTNVTRYTTPAACEAARRRLLERRREEERAATEQAAAWQREQLAALEGQTREDCARAAQLAPIETEVEGAARAVKRACTASGPPCDRAKRRTMEAAVRELEAERVRHACQNDRGLAEALRARLEHPKPLDSQYEDTPLCRPER